MPDYSFVNKNVTPKTEKKPRWIPTNRNADGMEIGSLARESISQRWGEFPDV
jgi:hypothetical protein